MANVPVVAVAVAVRAHAALARFFAAMPVSLGAAFVVVGHVPASPRLPRAWPAAAIDGRIALVPDRIHLAPAGAHVSMSRDFVFPLAAAPRDILPMDHFLCALAEERGEGAVAVMLGDPGPDGARGTAAVAEHAGIVLANTTQVDAAHVTAPAERLAQRVAAFVRAALPFDPEALAEDVMPRDPALTALLVDARGEVLYIRGRTGDFLEPAAGCANWTALAMARPGLKEALTDALPDALERGRTTVRACLSIDTGVGRREVGLVVEPVAAAHRAGRLALIVFTPCPADTRWRSRAR